MLIAIAAYGATVAHQFVFDDLKTIVYNPMLGSQDFWGNFLSDNYFEHSGESSFRPLVTLSYYVESLLYGKKAWGYHLTNVALHALNALLVFLMLMPLLNSIHWAGFAAVLFAVHPAGAEAVNGISFREDLLVATFMLLAWLALRKSIRSTPDQRAQWGYLLCSAFLYLLACLSKETGIVFAALALLGGACGLLNGGQRLKTRLLLKMAAAYLVSALVFLLIWGGWMTNPHAPKIPPLGGSRLAALYNIPFIYAHHLKSLLWPFNLQADYLYRPLEDPRSLLAMAAMCAFLMALAAIAWLLVRRPVVGFGLAWIVVTLAPVSNVVPLFNPVADRYLYLPLIGFSVAIAAAFARSVTFKRWSEKRAYAVAALVLLLMFSLTILRENPKWSTEETLWTRTLEQNPLSWRAYYRLGDIARERAGTILPRSAEQEGERNKQLDEARAYLRRAISLAPYALDARNALASTYLMQNRPVEAMPILEAILELSPRHASATINLSQAYAVKSPPDFEKAHKYLRRAIELGYPAPEDFIRFIEQGRAKQ